MRFTKMEGLGNDFIVTDECSDISELSGAKIRCLCDRRLGIGADGIILVLPSGCADYRMRILNSDGSEAEMCGNGIRCAALYCQSSAGNAKNNLVFETGAGLIKTQNLGGGMVRVDMGLPILDAVRIPVAQQFGRVVKKRLDVLDRSFEITAVSMGNPHAVIFTDVIDDDMVKRYGPALECHPFFPARVNVEFVKIVSATEAEMRVWERGCGETPACGTGACATVVAGAVNRVFGSSVTVHLTGGDLNIEWDGRESQSVFMTGPAKKVFDGQMVLPDLPDTSEP